MLVVLNSWLLTNLFFSFPVESCFPIMCSTLLVKNPRSEMEDRVVGLPRFSPGFQRQDIETSQKFYVQGSLRLCQEERAVKTGTTLAWILAAREPSSASLPTPNPTAADQESCLD